MGRWIYTVTFLFLLIFWVAPPAMASAAPSSTSSVPLSGAGGDRGNEGCFAPEGSEDCLYIIVDTEDELLEIEDGEDIDQEELEDADAVVVVNCDELFEDDDDESYNRHDESNHDGDCELDGDENESESRIV